VVQTRAKPLGITVKEFEIENVAKEIKDAECFAILVQYPDTLGALPELMDLFLLAKEKNVLVIMASDLLALTLIKSPGEWGADIAVGSAQRFGVPMGFGGPHAGFLAVREGLERSLPGRLVGQSIDTSGNPALRLALQTREQHIRRDKATSNICTAQVLLANIAALYAAWHGPEGLREIAIRIHNQARSFAGYLKRSGFTLLSETFFDTLSFKAENPKAMLDSAERAGINVRLIPGGISVAFDETTESVTIEKLVRAWGLSSEKGESFLPHTPNL
jgi:glycine dehydrogenase